MSGRAGTAVKIGLGLLVSAVCLWLAISQAPIAELADVLGQVNYWWLLPVVAGNVVSLWARGCRWRVLLANRGTDSEYFWAQSIGCLLTNVFPLRAGEAGRVVIVSRRVGIPLVQVGASLVLERAVDLAFVLGLLAAVLLIMDVPWPIAATGLALGVGLVVSWVGVAVLLVFGRRLTGLVDRLAARLPERLARLGLDAWRNVLTALDPLRDARIVFQVVAWAAAVWVATVLSFWTTIEAVVPGAGLLEATFALTAIALGVALPSSPGFIGVFQLIGQQALVTPFPDRYTAASALTIALLNHAVYYVTTSGLGLVGMARLGLSLRAVRTTDESSTPTTPEPSPTPRAS
jgi:glycosyltransferase 2 family protein